MYWIKTGKIIDFIIRETKVIDLSTAKSFKNEGRSENQHHPHPKTTASTSAQIDQNETIDSIWSF